MPARKPHLSPAELLEQAEGRTLAAGPASHLERCHACRDAALATASLLDDLRAAPAPEPPERLVRSAVELFPARPPLPARIVEWIARLVPAAPVPAMAGVRGPAPAGAATRLTFEERGLGIDLEIGPAAERPRSLTGQVLAAPGAELPLLAWVEAGGAALGTVAVGEHGMFRVDGLPPDAFDLVLDLPGGRLRLPAIGGESGSAR